MNQAEQLERQLRELAVSQNGTLFIFCEDGSTLAVTCQGEDVVYHSYTREEKEAE